MSLFIRVLKLEKRAVKPLKPVFVIFQQLEETDEKVARRAKFVNIDGKSTLIVVKFIKAESDLFSK